MGAATSGSGALTSLLSNDYTQEYFENAKIEFRELEKNINSLARLMILYTQANYELAKWSEDNEINVS